MGAVQFIGYQWIIWKDNKRLKSNKNKNSLPEIFTKVIKKIIIALRTAVKLCVMMVGKSETEKKQQPENELNMTAVTVESSYQVGVDIWI